MPTPIVTVDNISKKFASSLKRAMVYGMGDIARAALIPHRFRSKGLDQRIGEGRRNEAAPLVEPGAQTKLDPKTRIAQLKKNVADPALRPTEFWAVKDVSFDLRRGECLGLIGHNGAGKSTIFKMLSGIYGPTCGHIEMRGSLSALIEVGSGFHPMLSGRENIYITGAIRGMSTAEIDRKFEQIVDFSGVRDFIDMPVKFYSSGMHVRLGFSVLAHLEPDILLIDEILAVGDLAFQRKCIEHVNKLRESDMALALVSHSLYRIESLCHRVIWLDHGQVVMTGPSHEVVKAYREFEILKALETSSAEAGGDASRDAAKRVVASTDCLAVHSVEFRHADGRVDEKYAYGEDIIVRFIYTASERIKKPRFNLTLCYNKVDIAEVGMLIDGCSPDFIEGPGMLECRIKAPRFLPKVYELKLWGTTEEGALYIIEPTTVGNFAVTSEGIDTLGHRGPYAVGMLMTGAVVSVDSEWNIANARKPDALADMATDDDAG